VSGVPVVSSHPPRRCGIGAHARTQVEQLRAAGHHVTVLQTEDEGNALEREYGITVRARFVSRERAGEVEARQ
jgi:hypothetical protein